MKGSVAMQLNIQMFGGRGASSGVSNDGHKYGTEYSTLYEVENIKFIHYNLSSSSKNPFETQAKNRIYVVINDKNEVKSIVFFDSNGMKDHEIDVTGKYHKIDGKKCLPHVHMGYEHGENGTREITEEEKEFIDKILEIWDNLNGR